MSFTANFDTSERSGFLRCDQPAVARRQLEMSIGLVVVLLIATFGVLVTTPLMSSASLTADVVQPTVQKASFVHAPVRVIQIYNDQATERGS